MPLQNLISLLEKICSDVIQQGTLGPAEPYPARFFTHWNRTSDDHKHYDNAAYGYAWTVDVNFYGTDPVDVYDTLEQARTALLKAGWSIGGKGHAVASDEPNYTGRGFTAVYLEI